MGNAHGHTTPPRHVSSRETIAWWAANGRNIATHKLTTIREDHDTTTGTYPGDLYPGDTPASTVTTVTVERFAAVEEVGSGRGMPILKASGVTITGGGSGSPMAEVRGADTLDGLTGLVARHVPTNPLR